MKKHNANRCACAVAKKVLSGILVLSLIFSQPIWNVSAEPSSSAAPTSSPTQTSDPSAAPASTAVPTSTPEHEPTPAPTSTPPPAPVKFVVSYVLSSTETISEEVPANGYPVSVPAPAKPTYQFLGWVAENGAGVSPEAIPVTANVTYYAKYGRDLSTLLNTVDHFPYVNGYENNFFKPDKSITRAEVTQLFYTLLLNKNGSTKSFPDVGAKWYKKAVETLAGLDIVNGYTNGYFRPNNAITRAEFVKMAVCFDTVDTVSTLSFSDVSTKNWAYSYIATAVKKGWVVGYSGNKFKPDQPITRAEAVTIINRMLGRYPDANITGLKNTKKFYDVNPTSWYYGQITEAAIDHKYTKSGAKEIWTTYQEAALLGGTWVYESGKSYYVDPTTLKFASGEITINGTLYYFDPTTKAAYTGFQYISGWKRYFKDGKAVEDISGLGLVSGPYYIRVYKPGNYLIIFARDGANGYTIPVRAMRVSCGNNTPTGTFYTPAKFRWLRMEGYSWAQWCTQISGNYLFHSVPNYTKSNQNLNVGEYNQLGNTRSLGCIRLNCADAKWIYDNCGLGTQVFIAAGESSGVLAKPASLQIPAWHTWDPTDPTAYPLCRQRGCH